MRATRAYIASAGTAAVMLAASLSVFAMVSGLVAFGAWPANATPTSIDEMLVTTIERPKPHAVQVRRDAGLEQGSAERSSGGSGTGAGGGAGTPSHSTSGAGTAVGSTPTASAPAGATQGGGSGGGGQTTPDSAVKTVTRTTQPLLQNAPQPVQDVANQVNQVIDQVGSSVPPPETVVDDTVGGVVGR